MVTEVELDADERLIQTIRRSYIGLVPIIVIAAAAFLAMLWGVYWVARYQATVTAAMPVPAALLLILGTALLVNAIAYLAAKVYLANRMTLTNERLVLITQISLFSQDVPQLSLADVQEVTVKQNGIIANLFGYGTIIVETAGEQKNIILRYAKDPHRAADQINDAAEVYKQAQTPPPAAPPQPPPPAPSSPIESAPQNYGLNGSG